MGHSGDILSYYSLVIIFDVSMLRNNNNISGWVDKLLRRETSCFNPSRSGFTNLGSISCQSKIMDVPVFYHEVNLVLIDLDHYLVLFKG